KERPCAPDCRPFSSRQSLQSAKEPEKRQEGGEEDRRREFTRHPRRELGGIASAEKAHTCTAEHKRWINPPFPQCARRITGDYPHGPSQHGLPRPRGSFGRGLAAIEGDRDMEKPMHRAMFLTLLLSLAACNREQPWRATNITGAMPRLEFRL